MPASKPDFGSHSTQANIPAANIIKAPAIIKVPASVHLKSVLISVMLLSLVICFGTLPHWLQQPFIPLERTDMRQSEGIEAALRPVIQRYTPLDKPVVIALYRPGCLCNYVSLRHETEIHAFATKNQVLFQRMDASNLSIPSTPALLILDETGGIRYFGAYGFGAFCGASSVPYVQRQLTLMLRGDHPEPLYQLQGHGCYCQQPSTQELAAQPAVSLQLLDSKP